MSSVMAPIPMHQAVTGWHNQQLESRESGQQSKRYSTFSVAKSRDINDSEPGDEKPFGLTLKEIFSSTTTLDSKREPDENLLDTSDDTQKTATEAAFSLEDAPNEADSVKPISAIWSDPDDASTSMQLASASAEVDGNFSSDIGHGEVVDMMESTPEQQEPEEQPKSASERRAEKRKMKRFRLTHNQTRFLMSEFTRQAHPDAAHRERLAREIPGLSPRQVQVWFQNRRAKLKRLTNDDRERMLKSRALPEDFDMTQALHSPYGSQPQTSTEPLASTANYFHQCTENGVLSPITIDGAKRTNEDEYVTSPLSATSTYSAYFPSLTTASVSTSESGNLPPNSTACDRSGMLTSVANTSVSARRHMNLFSRSGSFSNSLPPTSYAQVQRLSSHTPVTRTRTGSLASPYRAGTSYTAATLDYSKNDSSMGLYNGQAFESSVRQAAADNETVTYNSSRYGNSLQGLDSKSNLRLRTSPASLNSELNIKAEFKEGSDGLQSAPLPLTQEDQLSPLSAHFSPNPFSVTYTHQNTSTMSLPASFYPFNSTSKAQDGFSAPYESSVNLHHTLDSLRDRAYTTPLGFSSEK